MSQQRPTYREIARETGVHYTTVGRALRNHPKISARTRARVLAKAMAMGYRPDPLVSALMTHKAATTSRKTFCKIAVLVDSRTVLLFPSVQRMREGVEARAADLGVDLEIFPLDEYDHDVGKLGRVLGHRGIRNLLFMSAAPRDLVGFEPGRDFSAVAVNLFVSGLPTVLPDHFQCMRRLLRELTDRGFRRPGLLIGPALDRSGMDRVIAAYRSHFAAPDRHLAGLPILQEEACDAERLEAWLTENEPDVVIESWRGVCRGEFDRREKRWSEWLHRYRPELFDARPRARAALEELLAPYPRVILDCVEPGETGINTNREFCGRKAVDILTGNFMRDETIVPENAYRVFVEGKWTGRLEA